MGIGIEHQLVPYTGKVPGTERTSGSAIAGNGSGDFLAGRVGPVSAPLDFFYSLQEEKGLLHDWRRVSRRSHTSVPLKGSIIDVFV